jgi:hypothetical protein
VPVRIVHLTDAEALEAQLIENLQRRKRPPVGGGSGVPRPPQPGGTEVQHRADRRKDGEWAGADQKPKRILLPVRQLQVWIERNVLLILKDAPFDREDPQLVPAAGSCLTCPKRTGHNKLLFAGISENSDACSDPDCYCGQGGCARKDDRRGQAKADSDHDRLRQTCRRQYGSSTQSVRRNPPRMNRSRSGIGRSTGLASTPPMPSSPKAQRKANSARSALTPIVRFIIRRSRETPVMRSGKLSRKSSGSRKLSLEQPVSAFWEPSGMPCQCVC